MKPIGVSKAWRCLNSQSIHDSIPQSSWVERNVSPLPNSTAPGMPSLHISANTRSVRNIRGFTIKLNKRQEQPSGSYFCTQLKWTEGNTNGLKTISSKNYFASDLTHLRGLASSFNSCQIKYSFTGHTFNPMCIKDEQWPCHILQSTRQKQCRFDSYDVWQHGQPSVKSRLKCKIVSLIKSGSFCIKPNKCAQCNFP